MTDSSPASLSPPFSPMLFAGLALRPLPVTFLSQLIAFFLRRMDRLYPEISSRMEPLGLCHFHIVPTDFWFSFMVTLDHGKATAAVLRKEQFVSNVTATISGDLLSLMQLLEGSVDGDALFFSRQIMVEGETEAVLTLRNAVDSVDLSVEHILAGFAPPLKPLFKEVISRLTSLHKTAVTDFELVHGSLIEPLTRRISQMDEEIDTHEKLLLQQGKEIRKMQAMKQRIGVANGEN